MPIFIPSNVSRSNFRAFVVKVSQTTPLAPVPSRVGNVVVVGRSEQAILEPIRIVKDVAIPEEIKAIADLAEFSTFESYLYVTAVADGDDLKAVLTSLYQDIDNYSVIVLTHAVSQLFLEAQAMPSPTIATMLTVTDESAVPKGLQQNDHIGVFLDSDLDGKVVMTITAMAQRQSGKPTATNRITNPSYKGITSTTVADLLSAEMFSFWIKSHQKTYPFALFVGGRQLYTILYEMYAIEAVMDAIADLTNQGNSLAENLELMPATILASIASFLPVLSGSPSIRVASLDSISQSDMVQGIISIEDIQFGFTGEHRQTRVHITAS